MAKLYFKYGAMGSSKTANALITKFNYEERGMKVWLIKPSIDVRDGADMVQSRIGLNARADAITPDKDLFEEEDADAVYKLGAILRMAEAFDKTRTSAIVDISCDILGDSVIMKTIAVSDNSFEIEKALEGSKEFEKYFHKKLEIL